MCSLRAREGDLRTGFSMRVGVLSWVWECKVRGPRTRHHNGESKYSTRRILVGWWGWVRLATGMHPNTHSSSLSDV